MSQSYSSALKGANRISHQVRGIKWVQICPKALHIKHLYTGSHINHYLICLCLLTCVCVYSFSHVGLCEPARLLCPWNFPRPEYLLQGIFLTQESNLCAWHLLNWQVPFTIVPPGKPCLRWSLRLNLVEHLAWSLSKLNSHLNGLKKIRLR